ncbi:MAG: NAD-dependent epimerase/dehydratase family protein [Anaplasmataceae bacterium]|nr:NAD-dependent epimerase/dehydratase family protein [Anaplasmataceae bacterium]
MAGFIGFHLAKQLKVLQQQVIGLDHFNDYYDVQLKRARADKLAMLDISCIEGDICDGSLVETLILDHGITHIVHLAAQAGVRYSISHPESYIRNNLDGFVRVLEVCRKHPTIPFIYASSSSVYGLNQQQPFSESDSTDHPASLYGATKKANEVIAHAYHHLYGIPTTGLRFFTVYGPWGRPDMAYFTFTKNILEGRPISVYASHQMRRDFTYIDDIVIGIISAIDKSYPCELFNLGNHSPENLQELIVLIEQALGKQAIQQHLPMQAGDVPVTYADIAKSQTMLGFFPKTSLKEGIHRFVEWYLNDYSNLQ